MKKIMAMVMIIIMMRTMITVMSDVHKNHDLIIRDMRKRLIMTDDNNGCDIDTDLADDDYDDNIVDSDDDENDINITRMGMRRRRMKRTMTNLLTVIMIIIMIMMSMMTMTTMMILIPIMKLMHVLLI
jgi:hypothetical protein